MTTILKRLLELIPTLIGVSILTFSLMQLTPGDPVRLMLGPEATPEAVTAKRVELGFQKYLAGHETNAAVVPLPEGGQGLLVAPDSAPSRVYTPEDTIAVHIGDAPNPVAARRVSPPADRPDIAARALLLRLDKKQDGLADGATVAVGIDRRLVNRHIAAQYISWISGVLGGDMGTSITSDRPVVEEIRDRLPNTVLLALAAITFAILTGLVVGILSAVYPRSLLDNTARIFVFAFLAMPSFWLGLELIILLSRRWHLFPPAGIGTPGHLVLPALTLGLGTGAFLSRILRSSMLQVLGADYVRTAQAKGLPGWRVILKHALKNAMIPFVTVAGLSMGALLGGSVIVETIFNWPGVGKLLIDSIRGRDFPVTMGCVLVLAAIFVLINLLVDLLYTLLDPRIRLDGGGGSA